ncbi:uncharacterized protein DUF664 [Georgenia soli]|uniref:Uncharacterized protein DUF664 n=1 Tax=Georgenia soli TaxID=638953 RepID=A0A2A9ENA7_9MICO|nr:DinB family protein [Georgenia soli]PFG39735.1 uncharacterized protein DUF664 [Georgenia soli]
MDATKATLKRYLEGLHEAVRWKVDGLGERDLRRPLTPTGTNILGVVKHLASVELGYLELFGEPHGVALPWFEEGAEDNADMWATENQSREFVLELYDRALEHSLRTIDAVPLDTERQVPWWRTGPVTLHLILVHVLTETARHAGHLDILREQIDGQAGLRKGVSNLPDRDEQWWTDYVGRLQRTADSF